MKHLELTMDNSRQRLDTWLSSRLPDISRSYVHTLITQGNVTTDGSLIKPSSRLEEGQRLYVRIPAPQTISVEPEAIQLDIAYEDEWLLVINKPQGMVVHPAAGHRNGTLVNALLNHCQGQLSDINGVIRPGIVHRIDKDTSGLLLVVKNNQVHADIAGQIRRHEATRVYRAVVYGQMPAAQGTIDAPIGRDRQHRQRMAVIAGGKPAVTHYDVIQRFDKATYLEARLETGRTHQIRVHLKYAGYPVLGDPLYAAGRKDFGLAGQALHACRLTFRHPVTGKTLEISSPLPDYFKNLLERLA